MIKGHTDIKEWFYQGIDIKSNFKSDLSRSSKDYGGHGHSNQDGRSPHGYTAHSLIGAFSSTMFGGDLGSNKFVNNRNITQTHNSKRDKRVKKSIHFTEI